MAELKTGQFRWYFVPIFGKYRLKRTNHKVHKGHKVQYPKKLDISRSRDHLPPVNMGNLYRLHGQCGGNLISAPDIVENYGVVRWFRSFFPADRINMQSPLVLEKYSYRTRCAGRLVYVFFLVFLLFDTISAQEQELRAIAVQDFYPQALDTQLRRIVESPAHEVSPLRGLCATLLYDLHTIVLHLEGNPAVPYFEWQRFEASVRTLNAIRLSWAVRVSSEEPYIPSAAAIEEITLALERRIFVWQALLQARTAVASPLTTLYGKNFADVERLKQRTLAVNQYLARARQVANQQTGQTWCEYLETQFWLAELETSLQPTASIRFVSLASPVVPVEILTTLSDRANSTVQRLSSPVLTNEQRAFLNHPIVHAWREELQSWTADTVVPIQILRYLERYEETGGMTDMRALAHFIERLSVSKTAEYRQLGHNVRQQYGMPNVEFFLSNSLLNNHLPPTIREIASFRDVIQSQTVVGRRQTEAEFTVSFVPHPTRILASLDVEVDIAMISRADAFASQLFNMGQTMVVARKFIELTEQGIHTAPSQVKIADHRMRLVRVDTDFDGVPILSGLFRGAVRNQYEARYYDANTESQRRILQQVRSQIDRETESGLLLLNEQIWALSHYMAEEFGLRVEQQNSRTEEDWLLTAWGVRGAGTLSSNTAAPATLPGSFADMKIHESLPNMLLGKLELEGKQGTVRDFKEMLAEKFLQPALTVPEENDDVELMFASHNPVVVRFVDGRAELTISIAALRLRNRIYRDFQVIVCYRPSYDSERRLVLEREGPIRLPHVRNNEQVVMRAAFGKIFPASRPFPLVPQIFENEPQFDYLTTGYCRIEKGWFALALVEKPK